MTRAERRKNPDYRIAELETELERLREEKAAGWEAYEYVKARLHRIEDAARAYVEWANVIEPTEPFAALRAALEDQ